MYCRGLSKNLTEQMSKTNLSGLSNEETNLLGLNSSNNAMNHSQPYALAGLLNLTHL